MATIVDNFLQKINKYLYSSDKQYLGDYCLKYEKGNIYIYFTNNTGKVTVSLIVCDENFDFDSTDYDLTLTEQELDTLADSIINNQIFLMKRRNRMVKILRFIGIGVTDYVYIKGLSEYPKNEKDFIIKKIELISHV
jgi:hypothetical protein